MLPLALIGCVGACGRPGTDGASPPPESPTYLPQAHSHNDYERRRPLFEALERGFFG